MNIPSSARTRPEHPEMAVVYVPTNSLQPYGRNARTHSKTQVKMIAESIQAFGFTNPTLTDQSNTIVAGHGRLEGGETHRDAESSRDTPRKPNS